MEIEKLKEKYDGLTIGKVEKQVESSKNIYESTMRGMFATLYYLERTGRFKENRKYKKETFQTYLHDRFGIRPGTYYNSLRALIKYPDSVERHGIGLVKKVMRVCDERVHSAVFDELSAPSIKTRPQKDVIIENHKKPAADRQPADTVTGLRAEVDRKNKIIAEQAKTIKEMADRIEKLKQTVLSYKNIYGELGQFSTGKTDVEHYGAFI